MVSKSPLKCWTDLNVSFEIELDKCKLLYKIDKKLKHIFDNSDSLCVLKQEVPYKKIPPKSNIFINFEMNKCYEYMD